MGKLQHNKIKHIFYCSNKIGWYFNVLIRFLFIRFIIYLRWPKQTPSNPNLGLHSKEVPTLSLKMTSFQTSSPSNLPESRLPPQSLLRNLSRSQRRAESTKMIRNSNSGSPSETLTLFTSDLKTKAIKFTTIMVSRKIMDTNSISTQVCKASVASVETPIKLDFKPEEIIGLLTSELPLNQLILELLFSIKLLLPRTSSALVLSILCK